MNGGNGRPEPADRVAEDLAQGLSLPLADETLDVEDWEEALQAGALDSAFGTMAEPGESASPAAGPEPEGAGPAGGQSLGTSSRPTDGVLEALLCPAVSPP